MDVAMEFALALNASTNDLLIQVEQMGGQDTVVTVKHLYRFEKPVADGGYLVLPHGSGYLIPAECPDAIPGQGERGGLIGARWTLPLFGMVRGKDSLCAMVETWWDCEAQVEHIPNDRSVLDFHWVASLGTLAYPRRLLLRFDTGLDYVGMAKLYRAYARDHGLLRTLGEKAANTPVIRRYVENVLVRWPAWNTEQGSQVLADLRRLPEMGLGVNFFFPKWSSVGYAPGRNTGTTADSGWQAYLQQCPVPGGWPALADYAGAVRRLGCTIQGFVCPLTNHPEAPDYDEDRWPRDANGHLVKRYLSVHDALERMKKVLDNLEANGLKLDVLYFDGYSAHAGLPEDFTPSRPVTRRQTFEQQNVCFAETRRRGIMPGGELPRFWCIPECDYFFFSDWSQDRLTNVPTKGAPSAVGEPVPLFQLVFHDCTIAGFSGGGYALYAEGYDWWAGLTPRLYELLFAAAPAHNWLVGGHVPVKDWDSPGAKQRWTWLKRWSAYYRAVAMSEMVSHQFLSPAHRHQRIEFANGVAAEFNLESNEVCVKGVTGFSGEWENPAEI
ncbi:MAG: hypothetical protein HYU36_18485 [Planctomycetes bacterium]|nr:hypothetical protein [Planctomycetota bacterium]